MNLKKLNLLFLTIIFALVLHATAFILPNNINSFTCQFPGRFEDPNDYSSYFECLPESTDRKLKLTHRTCLIGNYNASLGTCIYSNKINKVTQRQGRQLIRDSSFDHLCKENVNENCADCYTQLQCAEGSALIYPCQSDTVCRFDAQGFAGTSVCYPVSFTNEICQCPTDSPKFIPDPYNSEKFYYCNAREANTYVKAPIECPKGYEFDKTEELCTNTHGLPDCLVSGKFARPGSDSSLSDCTNFYACMIIKHGWLQTTSQCPEKTLFNEGSGKCEDPCNWNWDQYTCTASGNFEDLTDCSKYFTCIVTSEQTYQFRKSCPSGFHFHPEEKKCISIKNFTCKATPMPRCEDYHKEWCFENQNRVRLNDRALNYRW